MPTAPWDFSSSCNIEAMPSPTHAGLLGTSLVFTVASGLAACGGETPSAPGLTLDAGTTPLVDSGTVVRVDGGSDGDGSAPVSDGGGVSPDGGEPAGCAATPARRLATSGVNGMDRPAIAVRNDGLLAAWVGSIDGTARIMSQWIPAADELATALSLTGAASTQNHPAIADTRDGFVVAWADSRSGGSIYVTYVDGAGVAAEEEIAVVAGTPTGPPAVAHQGDETLVFWTEQDGSTQRSRLVEADGTLGEIRDYSSLGANVSAPVLRRFGSGFGLAFLESESGEVRFVELGASGAASSSPVTVDTEHNATSELDLAVGPAGGAVSWVALVAGERAEVRARSIDASGAPVRLEAVLTPPPSTGRFASVSGLGAGWTAAYRRSEEGSDTVLRLDVLDDRFEAVRTFDLATVSDTPSAISTGASFDGSRIATLWNQDGALFFADVRCSQ